MDHALGNASVPGDSFGIGYGISADGRYVVISTGSTNLSNPPTEKNYGNGFRHDLLTGENLLLTRSVVSGKVGCNGSMNRPKISANGNWISFESWATDLIASYSGNTLQIYDFDVAASQMTLVSHDSANATTGGNGDSYGSGISDDGQFITYSSYATNLINGFMDGNENGNDIFLIDRGTGQTT